MGLDDQLARMVEGWMELTPMWKMFITIIAMSDTGSVSTNIAITDYNSRGDCELTAKVINGRTSQDVVGHKFNIVVTAQCVGDAIPQPPTRYYMQR